MARADQLLIRQSAREPSAKESRAETESSALLAAGFKDLEPRLLFDAFKCNNFER